MTKRCACGYAPDWCYKKNPDTTKYCRAQTQHMIPLYPDKANPAIVKAANARNKQADLDFDEPDDFDFG